MKSKTATMRLLLLCMIPLMIGLFTNNVMAQGSFIISKNANLTTDDRDFDRNDILYMKVTAPQVDFTDIDKSEWKVEVISPLEFEGNFVNHLDGTYTANFDLSVTDPNEVDWIWSAKIEDDSGNRLRFNVPIKIGDNGNTQVTIQGTIQSLAGGSVVVNGITIQVDNQTQVTDFQNNSILFSDLIVGDQVSVVAVDDAQGDLLALSIQRNNAPTQSIQVTGSIEELSASTITVVGKLFHVDAATEILNNAGDTISFDDLAVGIYVEVQGDSQQDGSLLATRIKIEDGSVNEVEFTGTIDFLDSQSISVDSLLFIVTNQTQVLDSDGNVILFSGLQIGMGVQIRGEVDTAGLLFATLIKIEDQLGEDEIEIKGVVTAKDENTLMVAGLTFQVTNTTAVLNEQGALIEFSEIQIGFVVQVRADVQVNGDFIATRIKVEDSFANVLEFTGVIESIGNESVTIFGVEIFVTNTTEILNNDGGVIGFNELHVGLLVEIRAEVQSDGTFIANRIKIEDRFEGEVEIIGTIEEIQNQILVVAGVTFSFNNETEILDNESNPINFSQLQVSLIVEIKGRIQSDGTVLASRIKVQDRIEDEVKVAGVIEQITQTTITILGRTFGLTENTIIFDPSGNIVALSSLFVGQTVEIRGVLLPDGTLVAIKLRIQSQTDNEIEVVGPIDSSSLNTIEVIGITFFIDANTQFYNVNNDSVGLADLRLGETVEVLTTAQSNGTKLTVSIRVIDVLVMTSRVDQVVFNGIMMLGQQVLFDSNTLILGRENEFLASEDLQTGNFVEVRALRGNNNVIFGTKVKVLDFSTSIGLRPEQNSGIPTEFSLLQNYPNPFNPETTIKYEVPNLGGRAVPVSIIVYNMLGQKIRNLVESVQVSGVYDIKWNGKDERGQAVPSGMYLYRLQAGHVKQTRRMILLK